MSTDIIKKKLTKNLKLLKTEYSICDNDYVDGDVKVRVHCHIDGKRNLNIIFPIVIINSVHLILNQLMMIFLQYQIFFQLSLPNVEYSSHLILGPSSNSFFW